jgi:GNAT superfamily N-acetyltransferase
MKIRVAVRENEMSLEDLRARGITDESIATMLGTSHASFCAEENGRILGFSMADKSDGSIFALFVAPQHEGRGAGSRLLEYAVDALLALGHDRLKLTTEPGTRAYDFYISHGWRDMGPADHGDVALELVAV